MRNKINCTGYYGCFYAKIDNKPYYVVNLYDTSRRRIDTNVYSSYICMNDRIDILKKGGFIPFFKGVDE